MVLGGLILILVSLLKEQPLPPNQGRSQSVFQGERGGKNLGPKGDGVQNGRGVPFPLVRNFRFFNLSRRVFRPLFNDIVVYPTTYCRLRGQLTTPLCSTQYLNAIIGRTRMKHNILNVAQQINNLRKGSSLCCCKIWLFRMIWSNIATSERFSVILTILQVLMYQNSEIGMLSLKCSDTIFILNNKHKRNHDIHSNGNILGVE